MNKAVPAPKLSKRERDLILARSEGYHNGVQEERRRREQEQSEFAATKKSYELEQVKAVTDLIRATSYLLGKLNKQTGF